MTKYKVTEIVYISDSQSTIRVKYFDTVEDVNMYTRNRNNCVVEEVEG